MGRLLSGYPLIQGGKGNIGHGGWEVSWTDTDAGFGGRLFLGKFPFLTYLITGECDSKYLKGWVPVEVGIALCTSIAPRLLF